MKQTILLFSALLLFLILSFNSGYSENNTSQILPDTCRQHVIMEYQMNGATFTFLGEITAMELIDTVWHFYIDYQDAIQIRRDSLKGLQMMY